MRIRALLVLALLAALLGAPSVASGAGNTLLSPQVSPDAGTIETVFTLTVSYEGQFPATGVTAAVGGRVLTMSRVAGTAESGTWSASGSLPAGTWAPLFTATAERGNVATVTASLVAIVASPPPAATPQPTVTTSPKSPPRSTDDGGVAPVDPGAPGADGSDPPSMGEVPGADPAEENDPHPSGGPAPASSPAGADSPTGNPDGAPGADAPAAAWPEGGGTASMPPSGPDDGEQPAAGPVMASGPPSAPTDRPVAGVTARPNGDRELRPKDSVLETLLLVGLAGVAAVALAGSMLLIISRRRSDDREDPDGRGAAAAATVALLERRTVARAHVRLDEDPIVAALGIDEEDVRRARRTGGQNSRG